MADQLHDTVQKMIDAGESEENIATVIKGYRPEPAQPQVRSRTGQMYTPPTEGGGKEFIGGALGALGDAVNPMTYIRGAQRLFTDPIGLTKDTVTAPIRLAGNLVTNPAETLGGLTTGIALSRVVPLAKAPVMNALGTGLEQVGEKGAWAGRITGMHQLAAGNPLGALTVAAPDAAVAGGKWLKKHSGVVPEPEFPSGTRNVPANFSQNAQPIRVQASPVPTTPRVPYSVPEAAPAISAEQAAEDALLLKHLGTPEAVAKFKAGGTLKTRPGDPGDVPNNAKARKLEQERQEALRPDVPNNPGAAKVEAARQPTQEEIFAERRRLSGFGTAPVQPKAVAKVEPLTAPQAAKVEEMHAQNAPVVKEMTDAGTFNGERTNGDAGQSMVRDSRSRRSVSPIEGLSKMDLELLKRTLQEDPMASEEDLASMLKAGRFSRQKTYASPTGDFLDQLNASLKLRQP